MLKKEFSNRKQNLNFWHNLDIPWIFLHKNIVKVLFYSDFIGHDIDSTSW